MDLDGLETKPVMPLCFVDKFDRNALPSAIWEARVGPGKLLVCTLDITTDLSNRITARQLRRSILAYLSSAEKFHPTVEIPPDRLMSLFKIIRFTGLADNAEPGNPVTSAVDGDSATFWHTEWSSGKQRLPARLSVDLGKVARLKGFTYSPRPDMNRGRVDHYRIEASMDGQNWHPVGPEGSFPDNKAPQTMIFDKPVDARFLSLVILSDHAHIGQAAVAEFEPLLETGADVRDLGIVPGFNAP